MRRIEWFILATVALALAIVVGRWVHVQTSRQAEVHRYIQSLNAMYRLRAAVELYLRDTGRYPAPGQTMPVSRLAPLIAPNVRFVVPLDGWGHEFVYIASPDGRHSWLISAGSDGKIQFGAGQLPRRQHELGTDIVVADGRFAQVWEGWTECPEGIKDTPRDYLICEAHGHELCNEKLPQRCLSFER